MDGGSGELYGPTLGCERYHWSNEVIKSHGAACRERMAVLLCQLSKCKRNQLPWTRSKNLLNDFGEVAPGYDRLLLKRRSDRGCHTSGIEVWKLMRELGGMNKSLNKVTGVSQRGFDEIARELRICAKSNELAGKSGYRLNKARSGTNTSVCAVIRTQTQNGEENTHLHRLLHDSFAVLTTGTRVRQRNRVWISRMPPQPSAGQQAKTRAVRSRATGQLEDCGQ